MGMYIGNEPIPNRLPPDLFAGDGSTTTFNLSYYPGSTDNLDVEVSGVGQRINSYYVNGKQLVFSEAPPAPDVVKEGPYNIQVKYRGPVAQLTAIWQNAPIAPNSGTADAILANYSPAISQLSNNLLMYVVLSTPNITATPTFSPNGLTPKQIMGYNGAAGTPGMLRGTVLLRYDLSTDKYWLCSVVADSKEKGTLSGTTVKPDIITYGAFDWSVSADSVLQFPDTVPPTGSYYIDVTVSSSGKNITFSSGYNKVKDVIFDFTIVGVYRIWLVVRTAAKIDVYTEQLE